MKKKKEKKTFGSFAHIAHSLASRIRWHRSFICLSARSLTPDNGVNEPPLPRPPSRGDWICVEASFHEEMKRHLVTSGDMLNCLVRALDGDIDEQWALECPVDAAAFQYPVERPPTTGWTCKPAPIFIASNWSLAANMLALARHQSELERDALANHSVTPNLAWEPVSRHA